jgi:AraC family transcriptional regulator
MASQRHLHLNGPSMNSTLSAHGNTVQYGAAHGVVVTESRFAPGLAIGEHTHRTGYLSFTLAGSVVDTIAVHETSAAPGYSCYVPPGTPHANVFGASGARCLLVEIGAPAIGFLTEAGSDMATPWSGFGGIRTWRGLALYTALRRDTATSLDFEEFIHRSFEARPAMVRRTKPPAWLARARERIDAELVRPPSLAVLARDADVHPMHLIRVFRTHGGCSPGEYVQTRRIAHACRLLLDTDVPLTRLALHLGYHDQSHFTRAFKARIGTAPGAYRDPDRAQRHKRARSRGTQTIRDSTA